MHAETSRWRHHEIEQRSARARADYSADHFELETDALEVRRCRKCGCTDMHACPGGCSWVDADLCSACAGNSVRDPRTDPQPGDVLVVDRDVREVLDRVQDSIEYGFPNRAATRWLPLIRWQAWARLADVKKVAP